jgi:hypothetical protein
MDGAGQDGVVGRPDQRLRRVNDHRARLDGGWRRLTARNQSHQCDDRCNESVRPAHA